MVNSEGKSGRVVFGESAVVVLGNAAPYAHVDRLATPVEEFACDACGVVIPGGLKGYELYFSCCCAGRTAEAEENEKQTCDDGYDLCLRCATRASRKNHAASSSQLSSNTSPSVLFPALHAHALSLVDRGGEVLWANEVTVNGCGGVGSPPIPMLPWETTTKSAAGRKRGCSASVSSPQEQEQEQQQRQRRRVRQRLHSPG